MRIAIALLVLLVPAGAAAQQYGEQPRAPAPSGGPPLTGKPPPPGAPEGPFDSSTGTAVTDAPAAPPSVAPPSFVST